MGKLQLNKGAPFYLINFLTSQEIYNEHRKLFRLRNDCQEKETEVVDKKFRVAANPTVSALFGLLILKIPIYLVLV